MNTYGELKVSPVVRHNPFNHWTEYAIIEVSRDQCTHINQALMSFTSEEAANKVCTILNETRGERGY